MASLTHCEKGWRTLGSSLRTACWNSLSKKLPGCLTFLLEVGMCAWLLGHLGQVSGGVFMVASPFPACATWGPPTEAIGWPPHYSWAEGPRPGKGGLLYHGAVCTVQGHILLAFNLSLLFRLTRNGRSFLHLRLHHLTPDRKTGHWLKCPWRNPAPPRVGLSWWIQKCTRWFSAIWPHAYLKARGSKQGLDENMKLKIEPGTWLVFLVHQHWEVEDGNGHGRDLSVGRLSFLSREWGLMGGALSESERGSVVPTIHLWNSALFRNFEVADRERTGEVQDNSSWRLVYQAWLLLGRKTFFHFTF